MHRRYKPYSWRVCLRKHPGEANCSWHTKVSVDSVKASSSNQQLGKVSQVSLASWEGKGRIPYILTCRTIFLLSAIFSCPKYKILRKKLSFKNRKQKLNFQQPRHNFSCFFAVRLSVRQYFAVFCSNYLIHNAAAWRSQTRTHNTAADHLATHLSEKTGDFIIRQKLRQLADDVDVRQSSKWRQSESCLRHQGVPCSGVIS